MLAQDRIDDFRLPIEEDREEMMFFVEEGSEIAVVTICVHYL